MSRDTFEQKILPLFEESRREWLERAREVARSLGRQQSEVTVNDVRKIIPPPIGCDPRVMGAVFLRKEWRLLRHERSARQVCHERPVGVFTLRSNH